MRSIWSCIFLFVLSSCSAMHSLCPPELANPGFDKPLAEKCARSVVQGNWQFVHSIAFEMANGQGATVIGVTVLDEKSIKTGLMGVEGFVLFEAERNAQQKLVVKRALPPFDNPDFAAGLLHDVENIFLLPSEQNPVTGLLADGDSVCRYTSDTGEIADVILSLDESRRSYFYDLEHKRIKSIVMENFLEVDGEMIPENISLTAHGLLGYTLEMVLIRADKI